jgi:uncharacterized membrane protein YbjE (DUF340 family)
MPTLGWVVVTLLAGGLAGWALRRRPVWVSRADRAAGAMVPALVFVLGGQLGGLPNLAGKLATLGFQAGLLAGGAVVACAAVGRALAGRVRLPAPPRAGERLDAEGVVRSGVLLAVFLLGAWAGWSGRLAPRPVLMAVAEGVLYGLLVLIGISVVGRPGAGRMVRSLRPAVLLVPLAAVVGSLGASAAVGMMVAGLSVADALAVGAGLGWYSLSAGWIAAERGAELGAVALLTNVLREVLALVAAPLLARALGPIAPIAAAGAPAMDTALPVLTRACGRDAAMVALSSGAVCSAAVPLLLAVLA